MTGRVLNRQALLAVTFVLAQQPNLSVEFVVDTGFTDFLTLPVSAVAAMGLPFLYPMSADLADNSTVEIAVYLATVLWNGAAKKVRVLATGKRPLLGTALLDGCRLDIRFADGGPVLVDVL